MNEVYTCQLLCAMTSGFVFISHLSSDVAKINIKNVRSQSLVTIFSVFIQFACPCSPCPVCAWHTWSPVFWHHFLCFITICGVFATHSRVYWACTLFKHRCQTEKEKEYYSEALILQIMFLIKRESKQERSEGSVFASSGISYLASHHTRNISF